MMMLDKFDPRKSTYLIGHKKNFLFLNDLINSKKLPKVLLISGDKGIGKFTLISHLMYSFFDKLNYNKAENLIIKKSKFHQQFLQSIFPNIIYLQGTNPKDNKIEIIRKLKNDLQKTSINNKIRFIIFDDIELFNHNSLNALLKILEEPNINDYFVLIYNKSKPLLETIQSRCLELKLFLNKKTKKIILDHLTNFFKQKIFFDQDLIDTSPGNFLKYNHIVENKVENLKEKYLENITIFLNLYKKEKDVFYKDLIIFFTEYNLKENNILNNEDFIEKRSKILKIINEFFLYNLNQNNLLTGLERTFFYD